MPEALAVCPKPSESLALHWLALVLTPRLGPTRARRLVEHFGGVQNIFKASLTELEATGIQTVSVQSLGTGQSMELAQDELGRVWMRSRSRGSQSWARAIHAKGRTVAVFGTGVDIVYPKEKSRLTDQMLSLGGAPDLRISHEHVRRAAKFSYTQSHHQRHFNRRSGGGSRGIHRYQDYVALRFGTESRGFRRPRQRYQ